MFLCDGADVPEENRLLQKKGEIAYPMPFPDSTREIPTWLAENAPAKPLQGNLFA